MNPTALIPDGEPVLVFRDHHDLVHLPSDPDHRRKTLSQEIAVGAVPCAWRSHCDLRCDVYVMAPLLRRRVVCPVCRGVDGRWAVAV